MKEIFQQRKVPPLRAGSHKDGVLRRHILCDFPALRSKCTSFAICCGANVLMAAQKQIAKAERLQAPNCMVLQYHSNW